MPRRNRVHYAWVVLAVLAGTTVGLALLASVSRATAGPELAGTYRCRSFNVGGSGGRCQPAPPPIILYADGTFEESKTRGTYRVTGDRIVFSPSTLRGPGRLVDEQIVFEYTSRNLAHTVTYYRAGAAPPR